MPVTPDTIVGKILAEPQAIEIFVKHGLVQVNDPSLRAVAAGFPLRMVAGYLSISPEKLDVLIEDLNAAGMPG